MLSVVRHTQTHTNTHTHIHAPLSSCTPHAHNSPHMPITDPPTPLTHPPTPLTHPCTTPHINIHTTYSTTYTHFHSPLTHSPVHHLPPIYSQLADDADNYLPKPEEEDKDSQAQQPVSGLRYRARGPQSYSPAVAEARADELKDFSLHSPASQTAV